MGGRQRLLVAYRLRGRAAHEADAFRRALRSSEIERIEPHITLVPPTNVDAQSVESLAVKLEQATTSLAPFPVTFRGVETFAPLHHVIYLRVGEGISDLEQLRARCQVGGLEVDQARPFVPHVTLKSHADPELAAHARAVLADFALSVELDRVTLLRVDEQSVSRRWVEEGEFVLGSAMTLGRGSEEVGLTLSSLLNGEDKRFIAEHGGDRALVNLPIAVANSPVLVLRARIGGLLVGLLLFDPQGAFAEIICLVVDARRRRMGTGGKLLKYLGRIAAERSITQFTVQCDEQSREFFGQCGFLPSARSAGGSRMWLFGCL